ncbi:MAG: hypothetical protein DRJ35_05500 [Thermoprotei archaeon]|nr:MAG: hypothetical protein DRJ35_05500 [Thermoprotei archaeon]
MRLNSENYIMDHSFDNALHRGRLRVYHVVMKPYHSLLARAARNSSSILYIYGITKFLDTVALILHCEFPHGPKSFMKFINTLKSSPKVKNLSIIEKKSNTCLLYLEKERCEFYDYTMSEGRIIFFPYLINPGGRRFYIMINDAIDNLKEILSKYGHLLEVQRTDLSDAILYTGKLMIRSELSAILTPMQKKVLMEAINKGFFEWPRRAKLEDLSRSLNISKATISEHIRKAEQKVMELLSDNFQIQTRKEKLSYLAKRE